MSSAGYAIYAERRSFMLDYSDTWNGYWQRPDRVGESSFDDPAPLASQILATCGPGHILDIGCGMGALVRELLKQGTDAYGVDVSSVAAAHCNRYAPGRFFAGSILKLPFQDESFDTLISTDCLEHLAPEDVPQALREMRRVCRRNLFLRVATGQDRDGIWHLTVEPRNWWEKAAFEAGFRKHPDYYLINPYESLEHESNNIAIPLEKIPSQALLDYPLAALAAERGLHMDMLRDTGERSDAHIVRYQWASEHIRPGERILDAACGLGYGSYLMRSHSWAARILGIDSSAYAIGYADKLYANSPSGLEFRQGMLPEILAEFEDASFDVIVSFETLEHVAEPEKLLHEFHRMLTPGGRIIVSVPNDWSDASGADPNPYHLHVYHWDRLCHQLEQHFILERVFQQVASQCKRIGQPHQWEKRPRQLKEVPLDTMAHTEAEWWLATAMKSPLEKDIPYAERIFSNVAGRGHASLRYTDDYNYPWLIHAMVNSGYRLKNSSALHDLAENVCCSTPPDSADHAAALCVLSYQLLNTPQRQASEITVMVERLKNQLTTLPQGAIGLRWQISLNFVCGQLLQDMGDLHGAMAAYDTCASLDFTRFGIHLGTKTTEALFLSGKLALALCDYPGAELRWQKGINMGNQLLAAQLEDVVLNPDFPNRFHHGDGIREYALAWDNIARCANGLHALRRGRNPIKLADLEVSFMADYRGLHDDLLSARREHLAERHTDRIRMEELQVMLKKAWLCTIPYRIRRLFRRLLIRIRAQK